jgi:hypothetical protein
VHRVRVTTPNVLVALRKRDPGSAKPYNFALSPILVEPVPHCTLVAPMCKHSEDWLTREYTEIHTGATLKLYDKYQGKRLTPQTLSNVIWRHYLHPEDKSLSPSGEPCNFYTRGLLSRRPIEAIIPFGLIGKEIERRAQEGEDPSMLESSGPRRYGLRQGAKTRPADSSLILRASRFSKKALQRKSGASQHAIDRFFRNEPVHPATRQSLQKAVEDLEREAGKN